MPFEREDHRYSRVLTPLKRTTAGPFRLYSRRTTFKVIILAMFGIKLKLDSRKISSWLFFDPICIMGGAKRRQSGGTSGRISLMSSLPVDGTARAHENRRHCSRPDFAPSLPGVLELTFFLYFGQSKTSRCDSVKIYFVDQRSSATVRNLF